MIETTARLTGLDMGRRFYAAERAGRTYHVEHNVVTGRWRVSNARGTSLGDWSDVGRAVVAACERAFAALGEHELLVGAGNGDGEHV